MRGIPAETFLVVADAPAARQTLRNICSTHEETVVRRFGRAVLFEATEFGAFLALRLRAKHGDAISLRWTSAVDEASDRLERAAGAAEAFEARAHKSTPYPKFAASRSVPSTDEMRARELDGDGGDSRVAGRGAEGSEGDTEDVTRDAEDAGGERR